MIEGTTKSGTDNILCGGTNRMDVDGIVAGVARILADSPRDGKKFPHWAHALLEKATTPGFTIKCFIYKGGR